MLSISFFNGIKYLADEFRNRDSDFFGNGVVSINHFPYTLLPNSMNIQIGAGTAWVDGYRIVNDTSLVTLTVPVADTQQRIDIVQVGHDDLNSQAVLTIKKGVASSNPIEPDADPSYLKLYSILVPANATTIVSSNITDRRGRVPLKVDASQIQFAGYTAQDVLAKLLTVDGSGSGLDADLLDGKDTDVFFQLLKLTQDDGKGIRLPANTTSLATITTPGQYYMTTAESALLTDHPNPNVSGWFMSVCATGTQGEIFQELTRNNTSVGLERWVRIVNSAIGSWALIQSPNITSGTGGVKLSISDTTKDLLQEITKLGQGLHTFYAVTGTINLPPTGISTRGIAHITGTGFCWIYASDYNNNIFTNYQNGGVWTGWKQLETTTGGTFAKSYGLGDVASIIANTDLNNLDVTGFYKGSNLTNGPLPPTPTTNFFVINLKHNTTYRTQIAYFFGSGSTGAGQEYRRQQNSGIWSAWTLILADDSTRNALTLQNGVLAYTSGTSPVYSKVGNQVTLQGMIKNITTFPTTIGTLPAGFRPTNMAHTYAQGSGIDTGNVATVTRFTINTDGTIVLDGKSGTATNTATYYPVDTVFSTI